MIGKFLVCAFVCAALTQVRGETLEYAVQRALFRLQGMATGAEKGIDGAIKETAYKQDSVQVKAKAFLERESRQETLLKQNVKRTAEEMEKRAKEANKPPSVFDCIAKAQSEVTTKLETFGTKFQVDMNRLQRTKLENMDVSSKPLAGLKSSLPDRLVKAQVEVQSCKDVESVRKVMDRIRRDYELLNSELRRIVTQVTSYYNLFVRDASNMFTNLSRQSTRIQTEGMRAIKTCLYRKELVDMAL